jgi:hypothetical protein
MSHLTAGAHEGPEPAEAACRSCGAAARPTAGGESTMSSLARPATPGFAVRLHRERDVHELRPCLILIHGGGCVIGTDLGDDGRFDRWSTQLRCVGVSVGYRLAPASPFPGPPEECYAALQITESWPEIPALCPLRYARQANRLVAAPQTGGSSRTTVDCDIRLDNDANPRPR